MQRFDKEEARGKWLSIFRNLGIDIREDGKHGKCPLCGREKTKGIRFTNVKGNGEWICTCSYGDGWDMVQKKFNLDFQGAIDAVGEVIGHSIHSLPREKKLITREELNDMFSGARQFSKGDIVDYYLGLRGLKARPRQNVFSHHSVWHSETRRNHPAMCCLFHTPKGKAVSFHRTYLDDNCCKLSGVDANKKMSPALVENLSGGAVRLFPHEEVRIMGIAEGVETALAAAQDFGCPFWAATTAILLERWEPPQNIETVLIVADRDESFTGQQAAYSLAKRLKVVKKKEVTVYVPDKVGCDWLDVVNKKSGCFIG